MTAKGSPALRIEYCKPATLRVFEKNPRKISETARARLKRGIEAFGLVDPIIVRRRDRRVLGGHQRLAVARELEMPTVPVVFLDRITNAQADALTILLNNPAAQGEWDMTKLADLVKGLGPGFDATLTGFDDAELKRLWEPEGERDDGSEVTPDRAAELGEQWKTARGQSWEIPSATLPGKAHRILCGDATAAIDVGRLMKREKARLVFTDPPYGMDLDTDFSSMEGFAKGRTYARVKGDAAPYDPAHLFAFWGYCREMILWGADYYAERIPERGRGSWFVWDKAAGGEGPNDDYEKMFGSNFELAWSRVPHKRALVRVLWKGIFGLAKEDTKRRLHPTQKPTDLARWFLERFSEPGDLIVDAFLGSGSTVVAAERSGRRCYGLELEPSYVAVVLERAKKMGLEPRLAA